MGYNDENAEPVVFDIETVPTLSVESLLDPIRAPANYRDEAKILAYRQDKLTEKVLTASLEPDLCEVVAAGVKRGEEIKVYTRQDIDEAALISWLWGQLAGCQLIGYNILKFDLPVLIRRSQLLRVQYPRITLDRYRTPHLDLLERLSFNGLISYRSLAFYCRRFEIPCDDTIPSSSIPELAATGEWEQIRMHCYADVEKTALLAERLGWLTPMGVF